MFVNFGAASSLAAELGNRTPETLTGTFANVIDQSNNCIIKNSVVLGSVKLEFGNNFTIINGTVNISSIFKYLANLCICVFLFTTI
jgi:hypothetical protein